MYTAVNVGTYSNTTWVHSLTSGIMAQIQLKSAVPWPAKVSHLDYVAGELGYHKVDPIGYMRNMGLLAPLATTER
jgi:hypothetical protein